MGMSNVLTLIAEVMDSSNLSDENMLKMHQVELDFICLLDNYEKMRQEYAAFVESTDAFYKSIKKGFTDLSSVVAPV